MSLGVREAVSGRGRPRGCFGERPAQESTWGGARIAGVPASVLAIVLASVLAGVPASVLAIVLASVFFVLKRKSLMF